MRTSFVESVRRIVGAERREDWRNSVHWKEMVNSLSECIEVVKMLGAVRTLVVH